MKHYSEWKLTGSEIYSAVDALKTFISEVVALSEPFKVKATFVRGYPSSAVITVDGETYWINQRYCCFAPGQVEPGTEVFVDNRYIFKP